MEANDKHDEGRATDPEEPEPPIGPAHPRSGPAAPGAREGRVIGGVCAGLGRYFNVDPILFRIGAIALGSSAAPGCCCTWRRCS